MDTIHKGLFLAGAWVEASGGATLSVEDPATGLVIAEVADATPTDGARALDAAVATQADWAVTPPRSRGEILRAAYEAMVGKADELALLMTLEMGKPLSESRSEVLYAAEFFRWFSEEAVRIAGSWAIAPDGQTRLWTMKQPVGPCLFITPWNFPLAMGTRKIGPAVAAGCTMIVKPASQTPLSMLALAQILADAGLPDGVLSVLPTSSPQQLTTPLIADPRLRKLSFTGSTAVGKKLVEQAAHQLLRVSVELGGNAPFIVFDDADLDHALDEAMKAKLRNNGEACTAANRFYVQQSVARPFADRLAERFAALVVGRGADESVHLGPLIDRNAVAKVANLVDTAIRDGARLLHGGASPSQPGYFYQPTVLADVPPDSTLLREEIFGPVAPISTFDTDEEVTATVNSSEYGLAAYLFTRSLDRAVRISEHLEVGMIGLNRGVLSNAAAPFGGVKASGYGREGGRVGIEEYLETKYVAVHIS
ncbi:NAD-dependent succinate-semialdehyde dehydrogenase [Plantactinospora sp. B6F1]|uniref:NAD-dependent succinate-semialdehyde dehydrogenase n=1 Tax=Plantactinospora sp. B6F1 TaxID=3158971 RepID=UPI0032D980E8